MKVKFRNSDLEVEFGQYWDGSLAIQLFDGGFPYATASVWVEGLKPGEIAVKNYSENAGMLQALLSAGVVEKPHRTIAQGFVEFPIVRLTEKAMKELQLI
jgi:hypothetical protein